MDYLVGSDVITRVLNKTEAGQKRRQSEGGCKRLE